MRLRLTLVILVMAALACSVSMVDIPVTGAAVATNTPATITAITPPIRAWVTADEAVHVRDQAGESNLHISYLYRGDPVMVFECKTAADLGLWARIDGGWVNAAYLTKNACQ